MSEKRKEQPERESADAEFFGLPMNWDWRQIHKDIWNPQDDRIFPPKRFGIGWGFNVHALVKKMRRKRS